MDINYFLCKERIMNKSIITIASFTLGATLTFGAWADVSATAGSQPSSTTATTPPHGTSIMNSRHPCQAIEKACKSAGFTKGDKTGKALFLHCVKPILAGQTVTGVTVDSSVVQACQQKHKNR